jgi:hypothetical protein
MWQHEYGLQSGCGSNVHRLVWDNRAPPEQNKKKNPYAMGGMRQTGGHRYDRHVVDLQSQTFLASWPPALHSDQNSCGSLNAEV